MIDVMTLPKGEKVSVPGCYAMDIDVYHGQPCVGPSVSSSGLRTIFTHSPAHFWKDSSLNPDREPGTEKAHFALGRAAHHLLLGEERFSELFAVRPEEFPDWRSKASQQWRTDQVLAGKTVLDEKQINVIRGMAQTLSQAPLVKHHGVLNGRVELSMFWQDEETGIWLKSRPDVIPTDAGIFSDLKTTTSVGKEDLERTIADYRYDMQGAMIRAGARNVLGLDMTDFCLVFVEKQDPFCVEARTIPTGEMDEAEIDLRVSLRMLAKCLKTGTWPGPGGTQSDAAPIFMPKWARERNARRRQFLEQEIAA